MPRTAIVEQTVVDEGITPTYEAANVLGNMIPGDGGIILHVKNTGAQITVTIQTGGTLMGEPVTDKAVVVPATTGDKLIGPFPPALYNQPSGADAGKVYVDYSAVTGVTVAAFRV